MSSLSKSMLDLSVASRSAKAVMGSISKGGSSTALDYIPVAPKKKAAGGSGSAKGNIDEHSESTRGPVNTPTASEKDGGVNRTALPAPTAAVPVLHAQTPQVGVVSPRAFNYSTSPWNGTTWAGYLNLPVDADEFVDQLPCSRAQLLLTMADAITIHKSHGASIDTLTTNVNHVGFAEGLTCAVLSRVASRLELTFKETSDWTSKASRTTRRN
ncbi:hypothetical protein IWX90DRAFT_410566 [Phyllosticta citrichinensis]|uniref:Uncharacterized protein n=1 Tax=Phyllosticta citrichinensis TaxID=1130410 RepID=A0ABR1Y5P6_9PEZI